MVSRSCGSKLDNGSSNSMTFGFTTMARARAMRCCWPPERSEGNTFSMPSRLQCFRARATRSLISASGRFCTFSGKATLSKMFMWGQTAKAWNTIPSPRSSGGT